MELLAIRVFAAIQQEPGIELPQLHKQLLCDAPEIRDALDTLRSQGRIYGDRTSSGRVQYFPRRGKPLAQAVELAKATPEQLTGRDSPRAVAGSAAPGIEVQAPAPAANAAADFSGEAAMVVRAGSIVCRVYQAMVAATAPITAQALARQLDVNTPAVAVSLSMLASRQVVTYKPGAKKTIGGTYRMADRPRRVTIQDRCTTGRFDAASVARPNPADAALALSMALVQPTPLAVGIDLASGPDITVEALAQVQGDQIICVEGSARRVDRLQEKTDLLARLQPLVNSRYAELLGAISQDLTGVPA